MAEPVYEVYALKYAHHDRMSSENFLLGDPHEVLQPLAYFVWVITGPAGTFLVDTGFDEAMARKRGRTITTPVGSALEAFGLAPASITDVIITHLHYDHCGNDGLFPNARFHLQDTELAYATGRDMCHSLMRKVYADRVIFHDDSDDIAPGISVHRIGGHSKGLQCVRVMTQRGAVVLASDCCHLYPHFLDDRVYPVTYYVAEVLEGYATIRRLAASDDHVIPGHDPAVIERHPAVSEATAGLAVRVDLAPRAAVVGA
jgi:glyoxylase-like metal-dependent hydrolase (beta-lactamase superfamily II)